MSEMCLCALPWPLAALGVISAELLWDLHTSLQNCVGIPTLPLLSLSHPHGVTRGEHFINPLCSCQSGAAGTAQLLFVTGHHTENKTIKWGLVMQQLLPHSAQCHCPACVGPISFPFRPGSSPVLTTSALGTSLMPYIATRMVLVSFSLCRASCP